MTTDELNNITQQQPREPRHRQASDDKHLKLRNILNILFMLIMVVGIICWWQVDEGLGYKILIASIPFKLVESVIRMLK